MTPKRSTVRPTYVALMESLSNNTMICLMDKMDAVEFVRSTIRSFPEGLQWTITMQPEKSEDSYATTVTIGSSDDTVIPICLSVWQNMFPGLRVGSFRNGSDQ